IIGYITNATINQHSHKLSSGVVVIHSHPFSKSSTGTPFHDHNHSHEELILLNQISASLFRIYLFIVILNISAGVLLVKNHICRTSPKVSDLFFLRNYHAPPAASAGI
ncbi:MAG: hypothetical protein GX158_07625, partial [Bacteroidales bacterium]|nr:hypothetical protein [Bacteroidales bacterium]